MGKFHNIPCRGSGGGSPPEASANSCPNSINQLWKVLNAENLLKTEINFIEKFEKKVKFSNYFNNFFLVIPLDRIASYRYIYILGYDNSIKDEPIEN